MPIQLFAYPGFPHDIGVTKINLQPNECAFFLDFQRPLEKVRWLGTLNKWVGPTVSLLVPVAHASEQSGGYVIRVGRNEPYFGDIQRLWREHRGVARTMITKTEDGLRIIADFGTHFPEDCS
jgi:hypothetical protein